MNRALITALLFLLPALGHTERWTFGVYLDDKRIGQHQFDILRDGTDAFRVSSEARFDVKVLLVPVFRYRHSAQEIWRDGCLDTISTATVVNGKRYAVMGSRSGDVFEIEVSADGENRREALPGCIATYAYWDPETLTRHRQLLNSQTGTYQPVDQRLLADASIGGALLELSGQNFRIDLRYRDSDGRWQALRTITQDGRELEYRLEDPAARTL